MLHNDKESSEFKIHPPELPLGCLLLPGSCVSANSFLNEGGVLRWLFNLLVLGPRGATSETWFNNVQLWFGEVINVFFFFFLSFLGW